MLKQRNANAKKSLQVVVPDTGLALQMPYSESVCLKTPVYRKILTSKMESQKMEVGSKQINAKMELLQLKRKFTSTNIKKNCI